MVPPELPVSSSYDLDAIERAAQAAEVASAQSRVSLDAPTVLALVRDLRAARELIEKMAGALDRIRQHGNAYACREAQDALSALRAAAAQEAKK